MNLESLALLGEFVGGTAVLITIIYLAYQSRQNRLLLEQSVRQQTASMLRANIDGWNHMFASFLADDESIELYGRIRQGDDLAESDRQRAEIIALMFFLNLENFILQNQMTPFVEGVEEVVRDVTNHHVRAILSTPILQDWWRREKVCFSIQFQDVVDSIDLAPQPSVR